MHAFMNRLKKDQTGLTLIELIVVVAIIGVLAWLITPRVLEALGRSKTASADNFANEIMAAMERFAGDPTKGDGRYPINTDLGASPAAIDTLEELTGLIDMTTSKTDGFLAATSNFTYVVGTASGTGNPANGTYCIKLEGADDTLDRWITPGGVFSTRDPAQAATDSAGTPAVSCPAAS